MGLREEIEMLVEQKRYVDKLYVEAVVNDQLIAQCDFLLLKESFDRDIADLMMCLEF